MIQLNGKRTRIGGVIVIVALLQCFASPKSAASVLQINSALDACSLKKFPFQLQRYRQIFQGVITPDLTLVPCSRRSHRAFFGGSFKLIKVTGDRTEGCRGDVAIELLQRGRIISLVLVFRGSLPGLYCRDRNKVLRYRLKIGSHRSS